MSGDRLKPEDRAETERIEALKRDGLKPIRHEVWPAGWGFYRVRSVYEGYGPECRARYEVATVWGRRRAEARAREAQRRVDNPPAAPGPVFRTDEDPESIEQFVKRLPKPPPGPAPGAPRAQKLNPAGVASIPPSATAAPAPPPPSGWRPCCQEAVDSSGSTHGHAVGGAVSDAS